MPRLFPSLGRSKKPRDRAHDEYPVYEDYGRYEQYAQPSQAPAWRTVTPQVDSRNHHDSWEEEVVEYPSYSGVGDYDRGSSSRHRRPAVPVPIPIHESDRHSESTVTAMDHHYTATYNPSYTHDNSVPIVQRESSLTRLQEAFADHGPTTRPITELPLPQSTPRAIPRNVPPISTVPSARMRNVYAEPRQPVLVPQGPNTTAHSIQPDIINRSMSGHRGRQEERRSHSRRDYQRRDRSDSSDRTPNEPDEPDYPPCVVVVERGRKGKKDTYYVIPGGAPVIFEDDEGRELTRVGDFSGRYRPRRQRPVIIEDEHGNEIGRLGFDDESSLDYAHRNRSDDDLYEHDRRYDSRRRDKDYYDDRAPRGSYRSHRSHGHSDRDYVREDNYQVNRNMSTSSGPNLVYIPYSDSSRASSRHSEDRSSRRHYEPSHHSHHSRHSSSSRSQSSISPVIHLDQFRHRPPESVSSGSSGRRSYGDGRSYEGSRRR